jgi:hypothetical protein
LALARLLTILIHLLPELPLTCCCLLLCTTQTVVATGRTSNEKHVVHKKDLSKRFMLKDMQRQWEGGWHPWRRND